jgi:hypothetical protein
MEAKYTEHRGILFLEGLFGYINSEEDWRGLNPRLAIFN